VSDSEESSDEEDDEVNADEEEHKQESDRQIGSAKRDGLAITPQLNSLIFTHQ